MRRGRKGVPVRRYDGRVESRSAGQQPAAVDGLTADELAALRLSAQVMAHKADLADRHAVRLFFESLESAVMAELAGRSQAGGIDAESDPREAAVLTGPGLAATDGALIAEYLELLAANDRLPAAVRLFCRRLGSSLGRQGGHA